MGRLSMKARARLGSPIYRLHKKYLHMLLSMANSIRDRRHGCIDMVHKLTYISPKLRVDKRPPPENGRATDLLVLD